MCLIFSLMCNVLLWIDFYVLMQNLQDRLAGQVPLECTSGQNVNNLELNQATRLLWFDRDRNVSAPSDFCNLALVHIYSLFIKSPHLKFLLEWSRWWSHRNRSLVPWNNNLVLICLALAGLYFFSSSCTWKSESWLNDSLAPYNGSIVLRKKVVYTRGLNYRTTRGIFCQNPMQSNVA